MTGSYTSPKIGFIGFGQVASTFSRALAEHGARIFAYDILLEGDRGRQVLEQRAAGTDVCFCPLPDMVAGVDDVLCTAATHVAIAVAERCVPWLKPEQVYLDLNSTSPAIKVEIDRIISQSSADFVEGAILGAVGTGGARVRILASGSRGQEVACKLTRLGLNVSFHSDVIGRASTFKMLRSVFSKGLEALLIEFLVAAKRAGLKEDLWKEVTGLMRRHPFEQTAANWVQTHAVAYERRYHEMEQVLNTVRDLGLDPVMTAATSAFFARSLSLGLDTIFLQEPDQMDLVISFIDQHLGDC
jgi:3-hydroxyisobutyrate dehydrogenase-like beta-hydroxyacid dehydrogenase